MPVDYQNSKIYKLIPKAYNENDEILIYYGSTTQFYLSSRLAQHIQKFKNYLENNNKKIYMTSFSIFEKYSIDNVIILLVENYPCNSKAELEARERFYIDSNICVNKKIPTRTQKEYYNDNKEIIIEKVKNYYNHNKDVISEKNKLKYVDNKEKILENHKLFYNNNKDRIKERIKNYYENNKEIISNKSKMFREENKDLIKERKKKYYEDNKEKIIEKNNERITCEVCGIQFTYSNKNKHIITKKHKNFINNVN